MKRIGCDVDGVLACFDGSFSKVLIETSGKNLFPKLPYDPPCWDWCAPLGYTKEDETRAWEFVKNSPNFWATLGTYHDTGTVLDKLIEAEVVDGAEVYFITNRMGKGPKWQTEEWFRNNGYDYPTVLVSAHKGMSAAALELDLYIDDKPSNCDDVVKARGLKTKVFLMDRSWNQDYDAKYVTRVSSVLDMLKEVDVPITV